MIQTDKLWSQIVHYYIDKKGYTKENANKIAQRIFIRERNRKICNNNSCNPLKWIGPSTEDVIVKNSKVVRKNNYIRSGVAIPNNENAFFKVFL